MKRGIVVLLGMLFVGTSLSGQTSLDKPLASVRLTQTEQVGLKDFQKSLALVQSQLGAALSDAKKRELLESKIDSILLNQAAARDKITISDQDLAKSIQQRKASLGANVSDETFRAAITQSTGLSYDEFVKTVKDRLLQEKYLYTKMPQLQTAKYTANEDEMVDLWEDSATKFVSPALCRFFYVLIDTTKMDASAKTAARQKLEGFLKQIRAGGKATFDEILKKSVDDPSYSGSDGGYISKNDSRVIAAYGQAFHDAIFALKKGSTSDVLDTKLGLMIVYVDDRRQPKLLGLDEPLAPGLKQTVRDNLRQAVILQKQSIAENDALKELIKAIRADAEITYFEKNFPW